MCCEHRLGLVCAYLTKLSDYENPIEPTILRNAIRKPFVRFVDR
jgi:hypothetical protein